MPTIHKKTNGGVAEVKVVLTTPMLGTVPKNPAVYTDYVASKAPTIRKMEEEEATAEQLAEGLDKEERKGWTGFHVNGDGNLLMYDYVVRGFLKAACEVQMATGEIKKITAYKKWMDQMVFVFPRQIDLGIGEPHGDMERSLRTMTPKGPRVTLARSDFVEDGTMIEFQIEVLPNDKGLNWDTILTCLEYGERVGFGQWRGSGGYGRFQVVHFEVKDLPKKKRKFKVPEN